MADFNAATGYGGELDPKDPENWPANRILRPEFLETILMHEPYRSALPFRGVRIEGAWFEDPIDMSDATFAHPLLLHSSRFESDVILPRLRTPHLLSFIGSTFSGRLDMDSLQVEGSLLMRDARFANMILRGARIRDQLNMDGATFSGDLNMDSLQVGTNLFMRQSRFANVILRGARIGDQLEMDGSIFSGKLNMNSVQVGSHLFMRARAEFGDVDLRAARIGGQLSMDGSTFSGNLNMSAIQVAGNLLMRGAGVNGVDELNIIFADIGDFFEISDAHLPSLNLTGTRIHGEFRLARSAEDAPKWQQGSKLILRNADVGAIQDAPDAWPENLDMEGFSYTRLGGSSEESESDMATRDFSWYTSWLEKTERYSPQPYEQLANTLRSAGRFEAADEVLLAGRNRELEESEGGRRVGLSLLKIFIGYGYQIYLALIWFVGFVLLGWGVLKISRQDRAHEKPLGIDYSLDLLLPIIELRKYHYEIELSGWARYYFYFHILMGFVLASFLIAGLSGLTK